MNNVIVAQTVIAPGLQEVNRERRKNGRNGKQVATRKGSHMRKVRGVQQRTKGRLLYDA